jgi:glucose-1-phosphate thymidylyltransferase
MKGIILAGGTGSRLYPVTFAVSKQLIPIYDKPMIYYPMSVLMLAGIRDILIISTPKDLPFYKHLFENGSNLGLNLSFIEQDNPDGLAQSFILGEEFIGNDSVCLILGDNIFYGNDIRNLLLKSSRLKTGAEVFAHHVKNPQNYGIIEIDSDNKAVSIEEKPKTPKSNWAVTGLYFYDNSVVEVAKNLKPSSRGELEITDINVHYLKQGSLTVNLMGRGYTWLDTGTHEDLIKASTFVEVVESRQSIKIACLEEIAFRNGWIVVETLITTAERMKNTSYGKYLLDIAREVKNGFF